MCCNEPALPPLLGQSIHQFVKTLGRLRIEVPGGLVRHDQTGLVKQATRHGHPLLLAAGELVGLVADPIRQPYRIEELLGPRADLRGGEARDQPRHHHVFQRTELGQAGGETGRRTRCADCGILPVRNPRDRTRSLRRNPPSRASACPGSRRCGAGYFSPPPTRQGSRGSRRASRPGRPRAGREGPARDWRSPSRFRGRGRSTHSS